MLDFISAFLHRQQSLSPPEILFAHDQFRFDHSFNPNFNLNQALLPHTLDYFSPANPQTIFNFSTDELLQTWPLVWVRDGSRPLQDFFHRQPSPDECSPRLVIHEDLASLVPEGWQKRCAYYRFVYEECLIYPPQMRPQFLLLVGPLIPSYCGLEHLRLRLQEIADFLPKEVLKSIPHYWINYTGLDPLNQQGIERDLRAYHEIMTAFSGQAQVHLIWQKWAQLGLKGQGLWIDFQQDRQLIADSYVHHFCSSRGIAPFLGRELPRFEARSNQLYVPLSPYHGAVVYN